MNSHQISMCVSYSIATPQLVKLGLAVSLKTLEFVISISFRSLYTISYPLS